MKIKLKEIIIINELELLRGGDGCCVCVAHPVYHIMPEACCPWLHDKKKHANVSEVSEIFFLVNTFGFLGFCFFFFVVIVVVFYWGGHTIK